MSETTTKAALMTEHRDYIDGYAAGLADGRRIAPQPAAPVVSDEQIDALAAGNNYPGTVPGYRRFARAILALRPAGTLTGCNCRWDGETQIEWCELHLAHKDAIHDWAERAKSAEQKLAMRPAAEPMTERWAVVRETVLDVGRGSDVRTGGRPELGYALISDAATFDNEADAVAAINSTGLPVGWVVMPLSRLLPDTFGITAKAEDTHQPTNEAEKTT